MLFFLSLFLPMCFRVEYNYFCLPFVFRTTDFVFHSEKMAKNTKELMDYKEQELILMKKRANAVFWWPVRVQKYDSKSKSLLVEWLYSTTKT